MPTRHVRQVESLHADELQEMLGTARELAQALRTAFDYSGINFVINDGVDAGQREPHVHMHVIPRRRGDTQDPHLWLSEELFDQLHQPTEAEHEETASTVRPLLASAPGAMVDSSVILAHPTTTQLSDVEAVRQGCTVGDGAIIRSGSVIYDGVQIGAGTDVGHDVVVRERTTIGDDCYLLPGTLVHADVTVGARTRLQGVIANRSRIGSDAICLGSLIHRFDAPSSGHIEGAPVVEDHAFVGVGATLVGGVHIGVGAVVAAGAIVTRSVPAGATAIGVPARVSQAA